MPEPTNGWRSGRDPIQRWLRVVASLTCLATFAYLAASRQTVDVVPSLALVMGALMLLLGYEGAIRIPGVTRDESIPRPECNEPGCTRSAVAPSAFCELRPAGRRMSVDVYPAAQLVSSLVVVTLFGAHAWFSASRRVRYHDDRSAADLLVALTLLIASLGLLLSASATFIGSDVAHRQDMRNAGLAIVRGVLIVTAIVMVLADRVRVPVR